MAPLRAAFRNPEAPAESDQVASVIAAHWKRIVSAFEIKGFKQPGKTNRLRIDSGWHDTCRHYAGARTDGKVLVVAPEIVDLPDVQISAVLAHEAGHFVDFDSPARYYFRPPAEVKARTGARAVCISDDVPTPLVPALIWFKELPDGKALGKYLREWKERSDDEIERVADAIASYVMGEKISYTGRPSCLVQTFGIGIERPLGLR